MFISLKWTDANPSRPLSSTQIFIESLEHSGFGKASSFFCDEYIYMRRRQCDEAIIQMCLQERPDFLFLMPTQLDVSITFNDEPPERRQSYALFPRNETLRLLKELTQIPMITCVGDAYGEAAFNRFESMLPFSDKILLLEPASDFLRKTRSPDKYACLWCPVVHKTFNRKDSQNQDINVSFIGRTFPANPGQIPLQDNPLHQYAYRDIFLQELTARGIPVFCAGGAQRAVPLSLNQVADYFRRSKISLNFSYSSPGVHLLRGRIWEAINCGSLLFEEENSAITQFLEPMRHFVPFSGIEDAVSKIHYFLGNERLRRQIADAGHRVVSQKYNASSFWEKTINLALS